MTATTRIAGTTLITGANQKMSLSAEAGVTSSLKISLMPSATG